jgi:hypothetical protein
MSFQKIPMPTWCFCNITYVLRKILNKLNRFFFFFKSYVNVGFFLNDANFGGRNLNMNIFKTLHFFFSGHVFPYENTCSQCILEHPVSTMLVPQWCHISMMPLAITVGVYKCVTASGSCVNAFKTWKFLRCM